MKFQQRTRRRTARKAIPRYLSKYLKLSPMKYPMSVKRSAQRTPPMIVKLKNFKKGALCAPARNGANERVNECNRPKIRDFPR